MPEVTRDSMIPATCMAPALTPRLDEYLSPCVEHILKNVNDSSRF